VIAKSVGVPSGAVVWLMGSGFGRGTLFVIEKRSMKRAQKNELGDEQRARGRRAIAEARRHFSGLRDSRQRRGKRHALVDVAMISLLGMLCGCDDADDIAEWAELHDDWLEEWFTLPHGTPSQDTILRVFELLNPKAFATAVMSWLSSLRPPGRAHIAIDGKALRGSLDASSGKSAVHIVSAWMREASLLLGQVKAADKSNETTAIPALLERLDIKGCVVSIDAAGCYRTIAGQIAAQQGLYLLAVKENQPTLYRDIEKLFAQSPEKRRRSVDELARPKVEQNREADSGHGRIEERTATVSRDLDWLTTQEEWPGLAAVVMIEATRTHARTGAVASERRFYITNEATMTAEQAQAATRGHWSVENNLHWVLDVTFGEDNSQIRSRRAAENFAALRRVALSLLRAAPKPKRRSSIKHVRRYCDHRVDYLLQVLSTPLGEKSSSRA